VARHAPGTSIFLTALFTYLMGDAAEMHSTLRQVDS
jgi:hypothetical protein